MSNKMSRKKQILKNAVVAAIEQLRARTLHTMLSYDRTVEDVIRRIFSEETLNGCNVGFQYASETVRCTWAPQNQYNIFPGVGFYTDRWTDMSLLPPRELLPLSECLDALDDIHQYILEMKAILERFALVDYVFEWLNTRSASVGAMAYYCPWIRSCLPSDMKDCIPYTNNRFREPDGVGSMLEIIREANTIVATAAFLPKNVVPHTECGFTLIISSYRHPSFPAVTIPIRTVTPHV